MVRGHGVELSGCASSARTLWNDENSSRYAELHPSSRRGAHMCKQKDQKINTAAKLQRNHHPVLLPPIRCNPLCPEVVCSAAQPHRSLAIRKVQLCCAAPAAVRPLCVGPQPGERAAQRTRGPHPQAEGRLRRHRHRRAVADYVCVCRGAVPPRNHDNRSDPPSRRADSGCDADTTRGTRLAGPAAVRADTGGAGAAPARAE